MGNLPRQCYNCLIKSDQIRKGGLQYMDITTDKIDFNAKKGFICDMDGVIYHGNRILPGVAEFIQWLHDEDKEYLFLTNNSGYTPRELNQKLARMGLDVPEDRFYTSALATAAFLKEQATGCSAFVIGEAGLLNALDVYKRQMRLCSSSCICSRTAISLQADRASKGHLTASLTFPDFRSVSAARIQTAQSSPHFLSSMMPDATSS